MAPSTCWPIASGTPRFIAELDPKSRRASASSARRDMHAAKSSLGVHPSCLFRRWRRGGLAGSTCATPSSATERRLCRSWCRRDIGKLMWCYQRCHLAAQRLGRSPRDVHELRRWQYLGGVVTRGAPDSESARICFEQLAHDAGLDLYRRDTESATPQERLTRRAARRLREISRDPRAERVYPVDEAIRKLCEYTVISIVVGARSLDSELSDSLPGYGRAVHRPVAADRGDLDEHARHAREPLANASTNGAASSGSRRLTKLDALRTRKSSSSTPMRNAIMYAIGIYRRSWAWLRLRIGPSTWTRPISTHQRARPYVRSCGSNRATLKARSDCAGRRRSYRCNCARRRCSRRFCRSSWLRTRTIAT